ncbi:MAG: hypothetical protein LRZ85_00100 [Alphaproteobacteria bacterium]|nr:hypothetical protein [Alphaproteobacteria bacterium]
MLLMDESWRKRSVGFLGGPDQTSVYSDSYFIKPAISGYTNLHTGSVSEILKKPLSVIVMTDAAVLSDDDRQQLEEWVAKGGMLLRFSGPRLAAEPKDSLTPSNLMRGENHTAGTLSGSEENAGLAGFESTSPLAALKMPEDLNIKTRILPESDIDENREIWAEFKDGVPFIKCPQTGSGMVVLVHTSANMEWSNLPLSGEFFLDMMKAVIAKSKSAGTQAELTKPLMPLSIMDASGRLGASAKGSVRLTREAVRGGQVGPSSPPGFYGEGELSKIAHNLASAVAEYKPAPAPSGDVKTQIYQKEQEDYKLPMAVLMMLALGLLMADTAGRLHQNGALPGFKKHKPRLLCANRVCRKGDVL